MVFGIIRNAVRVQAFSFIGTSPVPEASLSLR
jgi:hypothetical protein